MAKISRDDLYNPDITFDPLDSWVGTDANDYKRTKTYYLGNISDYIIEQIESGSGDSDAYRILRGSVYHIQNLDFGSTVFNYYIGGAYYTAPARPLITLAAADPTFARKDVFVVNTNSELTVITGTPSANPIEPTIDYNTQIRVTVVDVAAGATLPSGITSTLVYDENAGTPTEYDATESTSTARINLASTTDPDLNTIHILGTGVVNNDKITFTYSDVVTLLNFSSLNLRVKLSTATTFDIGVIFYNGTDIVSDPGLRITDGSFGFDNSNITTYHNINIPIGQLLFTYSSFTHFVLTFIPTGASNIATVEIDNVRLIYGMEQIVYPDTYLALKDTFDSGYEGKALYSPVVSVGENGLILQRTPQFIDLYPDGTVFSGSVNWIENLDFESTQFTYYFQDELRTAPARDLITLSPSDPTFDRTDSFVLTTDNVLIVVEGTPSPLALAPTLDYNTQLLVTSVKIPAGATVPLGFSESVVYNENVGEPTEFTTTESTAGARINTASVADPYFGTVNIEGTNILFGDQITFSYSSLISVSGLSSLNFKIKNKKIGFGAYLNIRFYKGSTLVSSPTIRVGRRRHGFDIFNTSSYQNINIPAESILFSDTEFDSIVFRFGIISSSLFPFLANYGFYMDSIRLLYGVTNLAQKNTYLGLDDTYDSSYSGKYKYAPLVTEQESGLSLQRVILPEDLYGPNGILPGGANVEHIINFDFKIWGTAYIIDSVVYEGPSNYVEGIETLSDAHHTFSRYDVFILNSDTKAQGTISLDSGASGSVDSVTINGFELLSGPVAFNTDLNTTAIDVANDINDGYTVPNYFARAISGTIYIDAVEKGIIPNGYVVTSTTTTITTTDVNMAGGIDDTPSVGVLTGFAEANYQKPVADPLTQVEITNRVTAPGETAPPEIIITDIYNEDLGDPAEFNINFFPAGTNSSYGLDFEDGTVSILVPSIPSGLLSFYKPSSAIDYDSASVLYIPMKTYNLWSTNQVRIGFQISLEGVPGTSSTINYYNRNAIQNYGFDHTQVGVWQTLIIPMSTFDSPATNFDTLNIWFVDTPQLGFDHIRHQGGFGGTEPLFPEYTLSPISVNIFSLLKNGNIISSIDLTPYADQNASEVPVTDTGDYYTSTDVEGALQEIGNSILSGIAGFRKKTVIDYVDNTAVPPTEVSGDRYILDFTGASHANWDGALAGDIVEFNGTTWDATTPVEGQVAYVDVRNVDYRYIDDGSPAWEEIGGAVAPIPLTFSNLGTLIAGQGDQILNYIYEVVDGSGFTAITSVSRIWVKYLGTTLGTEADYTIASYGAQNLQKTTEIGNTTTLNIGALSFNTVYVGIKNTSSYFIGNSSAMASYTGNNSIGIGNNALQFGSTSSNVAIGHFALYNTTNGGFSVGIGTEAGRDGNGTTMTAVGYRALGYAIGDNLVGIGANSARFSIGDAITGVGSSALYQNVKIDAVGIGVNAGYYNQGTSSTFLGRATGTSFKDDVANLKTVAVAATDVDPGLERVTITAHGFGAINDYVNLRYTTTGTAIGGLTHNSIYPVQIIDANTFQFVNIFINSTGTDTHTFTPQFAYDNVTVLGAYAEPTKSNQITLGDAAVTEVKAANYAFNVGQTVGAGQDNYVLAYDNAGGQISLEDINTLVATTASNGLTKVGDDIQLGGNLTSSVNVGATNEDFGVTFFRNGASFAPTLTGESTTSTGVRGVSISGIGLVGTSTSASGVSASSTSGVPLLVSSNTDTGTNDIKEMLRITRNTFAGTAANGIGGRINFFNEYSTSGQSESGGIASTWTDATFATRTGDLQFYTTNSAVIGMKQRIYGSGQIQFNNYGLGNFTGTPAYALQVDLSGNIIEGAVDVVPNLQAVTDVGNTTTLNIAALSFNDLRLFSQTGVDADNIGIGTNALLGNTGTDVVGIGTSALSNNTGVDVTAIGRSTLLNNTADGATAVGKFAGDSNTGLEATLVGNNAGRKNSGIYNSGFGSHALLENTGNNSTGIGRYAGFSNMGFSFVGLGNQAGQNNVSGSFTAIGFNAGNYNYGADVITIGANSGLYNQGANNTILGVNAWSFATNTGGNKTFDFTDINATTDRVTVTAHGFGTNGTWVNVFFTQGTSSISGLVNSSYYQVYIVDANTISFRELISGSIYHGVDIFSVGTGTGHTLTPQFTYTNTTVLGANAEPTKSNQITLGDAAVDEVRMGNGDLVYPLQLADNVTTATINNVGQLRYWADANNSYVDIVMQTGASTYAWINIVQNNW